MNVCRYILFCAERLVAHQIFPTAMQLASACLCLKEKEPLRYCFFFFFFIALEPRVG